ncbi:MAG: hypothetical protein IID37_05565 [Planctomycetes bacterium]|nr:hypothetical protein [Planctomycetota bacterium]
MARPLAPLRIALAVFACWLSHTSTYAQEWPRCDIAAVLNASDPAEDDEFGHSLAADGDRLAVGAPNDDSEGSVRVFELDGTQWIETAKIAGSNGHSGDAFGTAVALVGDLLVVGAPLDVDGWGSAYIFRYDGSSWIQEQKLFQAHDGAETDGLGTAVAIVGETVLVGVPGQQVVRVFGHDGESWIEQQTLIPDSQNVPWGFGGSVAAYDDVVVIGAEYESEGTDYSTGAAYVFRLDGAAWVQEQRLSAPEPTIWDQFGAAVAIDMDIIMIGSPGEDDLASDAGAVYVLEYEGSQWTQYSVLFGSQTSNNDEFGSSLAVLGGRAVVAEASDSSSGRTYVFQLVDADWGEEQLLEPLDSDWFGSSVALTDDFAIVGADRQDTESEDDAGAVHIFELGLPMADCNANEAIDVCDIRAGLSLDVDGNNIPDECEEFCELERKLVSSDVEVGDFYGHWVDIVGHRAVVTSMGDDYDGGTGSVAALEFDGKEWVQCQTLIGSDATSAFGTHLVMSDDVILVGAEGDNGGVGASYVFRLSEQGWVEEQKLVPSDDGGYFGWFNALGDDVAVIGAPWSSLNGTASGGAYVFRYLDGVWVEEQRLTSSSQAAWDQFGFCVAISGDVIAVGAPGDDELGSFAGAVFIFELIDGVWTEVQKLMGEGFTLSLGASLAMQGDLLLAAYFLNSDYSLPVYAFRNDGQSWIQIQTLQPVDHEGNGNNWGFGIAMDGDLAIIAAPGFSINGVQSGAAYVYSFTGSEWVGVQKIFPSDGGDLDFFGHGVGIDGSTAIIGSPYHDMPAGDAGAAYVYVGVTGPDCNLNLSNDACDLIDGISSDENLNFVPDECEELTCEGDVNGDGIVDPLDAGFVLARFGCDVGTGDPDCDIADQNGDGLVDPLDVGFVLARFGPCYY